jgi:hypothetical protein
MFGNVVQYIHTHEGGDQTPVFVKEELKGTHRAHCLCYECEGLMKPNGQCKKRGACKIARALYRFVVKHGIVTPVFECPNFVHIQFKQ